MRPLIALGVAFTLTIDSQIAGIHKIKKRIAFLFVMMYNHAIHFLWEGYP